MTVASAVNRNDYIGTGAVSTYAYSFKVFVESSLSVVVADANGNETTLTLTTDYTTTGIGETSGGNIVLVNASQAWLTGGFLTTGYTITIRRIRPIVQNTDIRNQGSYFPETHEDEFDKQTMVDQQQQDEIDRSVKIAVSDTGVDTTLPAASADAYIGWNEDGDGLTNKTPTSLSDSGPNINGGDAAKIINVNAAENAYQLSTFKALLEAITTGGLTFNTAVTIASTLAMNGALTMGSIFKFKKGADVASAGALTLGDDGNLFDITGTTGITSITAKTAGTVVILQFDGILTVTDGSNLKLNGDFVTAAESTLTLKSDGTDWFELARTPLLSILDRDGDTGLEAERTADDDIVYIKTAGTDRVIISAAGEMTKPTQPCFLVTNTNAQGNIAVGSAVTVVLDSEISDVGSNFASNAFTAPITGKYALSAIVHLIVIDVATTNLKVEIITSNRSYVQEIEPDKELSADSIFTFALNILADMDANDTAYIAVTQTAGAQQTDIPSTSAYFSGSLIN